MRLGSLIILSRQSEKLCISHDHYGGEFRSMNRTGAITLGLIIMSFVGVVAAVAMFAPGITSPIATITTTNALVNQTFTWPAVGANLTLPGQATRNHIVVNATSASQAEIPTSNYTVRNYILGTDGTLSSTIQNLPGNGFAGRNVNISYTSEPYGYSTDGGVRAVTSLVILFGALAIALIAIWPAISERWDI